MPGPARLSVCFLPAPLAGRAPTPQVHEEEMKQLLAVALALEAEVGGGRLKESPFEVAGDKRGRLCRRQGMHDVARLISLRTWLASSPTAGRDTQPMPTWRAAQHQPLQSCSPLLTRKDPRTTKLPPNITRGAVPLPFS